MSRDPLSLYLHIPFCSLKCAYCDFNSYAGLEALVRPYDDALVAEMRLWREALDPRRVPTVFFGGGTPSLLPIEELERIMSALRESFELEPGAEVTLEANPGTVNGEYLSSLLSLGVNRLSLGVQSFHDDELLALDRIHSAAEAKDAYRWAREAGFGRVNLDLIYGLPDQPFDSAYRPAQDRPMGRWQATLEQAIELAPEHLSLYALTVEEGTKLAYDVDHGRVPGPDADLQAEMYEWSQERLARAGYRQYEISNWCRPGEECRHNLVYWRNGDWLGLGAGAHSHLREQEPGTGNRAYRFANVYSPKQYVQRLKAAAGGADGNDLRSVIAAMPQVAFVEEQPPALTMADTLILGLRLNEGVSADAFRERFGQEIDELYGGTLDEMCGFGLLERENGQVRLTDRGRLLANEVFVRLLPE